MSNKKFRSEPNRRNGIIFEEIYELLIYPDSVDHIADEIIKYVQDNYWDKYPCAYILHDKDIDDNGVLKKPHYHLPVKFPNRRQINAVAKELNIPENLIQWRSDWDGTIEYLVHSDKLDKHLYEWDEVKANFDLTKYKSEFGGFDDISNLNIILEWIKNNKPNYYQLFYFVCSKGIYSTYKRNYSIIKDIYSQSCDSLQGDSYFTKIV